MLKVQPSTCCPRKSRCPRKSCCLGCHIGEFLFMTYPLHGLNMMLVHRQCSTLCRTYTPVDTTLTDSVRSHSASTTPANCSCATIKLIKETDEPIITRRCTTRTSTRCIRSRKHTRRGAAHDGDELQLDEPLRGADFPQRSLAPTRSPRR